MRRLRIVGKNKKSGSINLRNVVKFVYAQVEDYNNAQQLDKIVIVTKQIMLSNCLIIFVSQTKSKHQEHHRV